MNSETKKQIERELEERKEKMSLLNWIEFLDYLKTRLSAEDLKKLFDGVEMIKEEARQEGYKNRTKEVVEFIDVRINYIDKEIKNPGTSDNSASFLEKLKINLEKIKVLLGEKK